MTQRQVLGAGLLLAGILFALSLGSYSETDWPQSSLPQVQNLCGRFGAVLSYGSVLFFGKTAWILPLAALAWGVLLVKGAEAPEKSGRQIAGSFLLILCFAGGMLYQLWPEPGGPGGKLGEWLNVRLQFIFGGAGTAVILIFSGIFGVVGLLSKRLLTSARDHILSWPGAGKAWISKHLEQLKTASDERRKPIPVLPSTVPVSVDVPNGPVVAVSAKAPEVASIGGESTPATVPFIQKAIPFPMPKPAAVPPPTLPASFESGEMENETPEEREFQKGIDKYRTPPLELLKWPPEQEGGVDQKQLQSAGQILEDTLKNFGIDAQVTQIVPGPTVTLYEVLPAPGVAVSRIAAREADLKLALAANSLRIMAPIPGKSVVGVEVPNPNPQIVKIRELLAFEKFTPGSYALPFALGKDILGKSIIVDLQKMPHVLIAGATGSGKSVCVASLLLTLLYRLTPGQLRLILIDPKRVELSMFGDIPHLLSPPILESKNATRAFKWLMAEMESRYNILSESGSKNLESYNAEQEKLGMTRLPYIVLVVDELADLMLADGRPVEDAITRLAQMSRAVGIHLVLATQRPSVDVITGLIKANMPARIAFQVASQFDARTILDAKGAESLLGRGDMLYLSPNASSPIRLQGAYVDEEEIRRVVDFIRSQMKPLYVDFDATPEGMLLAVDGSVASAIAENAEPVDPQLYEAAKRFIIQIRKGSTSMIQKKFKIGFNKAQKIMEMLERDGIVGPHKGPTPRDVLVNPPPHREDTGNG